MTKKIETGEYEKRKKEEYPFPFLDLLVLLLIVGIAYFGYLNKYPEKKAEIEVTIKSFFARFVSCDDARTCDATLGKKK